MAFISLLFIFLMFVVFLIGCVLLLISLILFITLGRKKGGKVAPIVLLIIGLIMVTPISAIFILGITAPSKEEKYEALENKLQVSEDYSTYGFEYQGQKLVPTEEINAGNKCDKELVANLVFADSLDHVELMDVENNSGYKIYEANGHEFVVDGTEDAIVNYYNSIEYNFVASWYVKDEYGGCVLDVDSDKFREWAVVECNYLQYSVYEDSELDKEKGFSITATSDDMVYYEFIPIVKTEDGYGINPYDRDEDGKNKIILLSQADQLYMAELVERINENKK